MKLPVPVQGSRIYDFGGTEREAELGLEHFLDAGTHEIDDGLGGVDDTVGVGNLDRVALEELLVNRVQEVLLVGEVGQVAGGSLNGDVEGVQGSQIIVPAEALTNERVDDPLDLGGDDIAAREVRVAEDRAK